MDQPLLEEVAELSNTDTVPRGMADKRDAMRAALSGCSRKYGDLRMPTHRSLSTLTA
jgi:hypothetical protein